MGRNGQRAREVIVRNGAEWVVIHETPRHFTALRVRAGLVGIRQRLGLSQVQMAQRLRISSGILWKAENGVLNSAQERRIIQAAQAALKEAR